MHEKKNPNFYIDNEFSDFKDLFAKQNFLYREISKGTILTSENIVNNTAYFIIDGIMHFSLLQDGGKEQTVSLFGPNEVFPIGVKKHNHKMDYDMVLTAFSDLKVYQCDYLQLRDLALKNPELAMKLLESDCDFISYLFYRSTSLAFNPCIVRVCDVLYLSVLAENRKASKSATVLINQRLLSTFVGASRPEVERALRVLRKEKIIKTGRNNIFIPDINNLRRRCSIDV